MSKYKYGTARIALFKEFAVDKSYTLEASLYGSKNKHFSVEDFEEIGKTFVDGLFLLFKEENLNVRIFQLLNARKEKSKNPDLETETMENKITNNIQEFLSCFPVIQSKTEDETVETVFKNSKIKNVPKIIDIKSQNSRKSACLASFPKIKTNKMPSQEILSLNINMEDLAKQPAQFKDAHLDYLRDEKRNNKRREFKIRDFSFKTSERTPKTQSSENDSLIVKSYGMAKQIVPIISLTKH